MRWFRKSTPATRERLNGVLRRRFGEADAARVAPWVMPAIGFHDGKLTEEPAAVGTTRFGGRPDLPESADWPVGPDGPLSLLAQIALADVAPLDVDRVHPPSGTLLFFYNIYDYAWGFDAGDARKFAVRYYAGDANLRRRDFPRDIHPSNRIARVRRVTPYLRWELPTSDPLAHERLRLGPKPTWAHSTTDPFTERYWKLDGELTRPHIPVGTYQLFGWANGINAQEEDCRLMCAQAQHHFPAEDTPEAAAALADRERWRCLLQVGSDRDLYDDAFADGGTIAFMIPDDDLRAGEFGRCWCVLSSS